MGLEIKLSQKLSQTLVMTPQLQQAIRLLQLGFEDYREEIQNELLENPILEEAENTRSEIDLPSVSNLSSSYDMDPEEIVLGSGEKDGGLSSERVEVTQDYSHDLPDAYDNSYDSSFDGGRYRALEGGGGVNYSESGKNLLELLVSKNSSLSEHLAQQFGTLDHAPDDYEICDMILGNLDRRGYLSCSVEELAESIRKNTDDIERVLKTIQFLDPTGVASRDLSECLKVQLAEKGQEDSLAWKIVDKHLELVERHRYTQIAQECGVTPEEVYEAIEVIRSLEPIPARNFSEESSLYVIPDLYVRKIDDEFVIQLNEQDLPRVRINKHYHGMLNDKAAKGSDGGEYIQDCLKRGSWLIRAMAQRQSTILKVARSLFKFQSEFLERGVPGLRPLVLREIAADVGIHESTVSRVTSNKYVLTPHGLFELKFFFSTTVGTNDASVSSEAVRQKIKALVTKENPRKPMSDQEIVNALKLEGISMARRTVAKYRDVLQIPPSSHRKHE